MRLVALLLLLGLTAAAAAVLLRSNTTYATQDRAHISAGSSREHWTGTDELGRDRTVRLAGALLLGFTGAMAAAAVAAIIAAMVGVSAAFSSGGFGTCLMYLSDLFLSLPWLFLLIMVRSALPLVMTPGQSVLVTFLLLALLGWPAYARVIYAGASSLRKSDWLIQARAGGLQPWQLARRHLLPHLLPMLLTQFLLGIPACLVAEANLGTLGLGMSEPLPSWGSMLLALESSAALSGSKWMYLPVVLLVTVLLLFELLVFEV